MNWKKFKHWKISIVNNIAIFKTFML